MIIKSSTPYISLLSSCTFKGKMESRGRRGVEREREREDANAKEPPVYPSPNINTFPLKVLISKWTMLYQLLY
jgi:hypothetical protein